MEKNYKWHTETKYFNYWANLILYCLVLLPFFGLSGIKQLLGDAVCSTLQSAALCVLALMVIFKVRRLNMNDSVIMYILFQGLVFARTVAHNGFNMGILVVILSGIFLVMLMQKDTEIIVRAMTMLAVISLVINFGYMLALGSDERAQYFIGGKNTFSVFLIPMSFFVMVNALLRKGRITRSVIGIVAFACFTIIWGRSGTGIITVAAMIALLMLAWKNKPNPLAWLIAIFAVNIMLVFFLEALTGTSIWNNIMNLLGKDNTLTSRAAIWEKVLSLLKGNWFFGVGRGTQIRYTSRWGYSVSTTEAHNFWLELVFESGLIGLCLYAVMLWITAKRMNMDSMLHRLVFFGFVVMMVNGLAEAINNQMTVTLMLALMFACANRGICEKNYGH